MASTMICGDVEHVAAAGCGMVARERYLFGPGAFIAPVQVTVQGTSVPAVSMLDVDSAKRTPAAVTDGALSGLRSWRRDPV